MKALKYSSALQCDNSVSHHLKCTTLLQCRVLQTNTSIVFREYRSPYQSGCGALFCNWNTPFMFLPRYVSGWVDVTSLLCFLNHAELCCKTYLCKIRLRANNFNPTITPLPEAHLLKMFRNNWTTWWPPWGQHLLTSYVVSSPTSWNSQVRNERTPPALYIPTPLLFFRCHRFPLGNAPADL